MEYIVLKVVSAREWMDQYLWPRRAMHDLGLRDEGQAPSLFGDVPPICIHYWSLNEWKMPFPPDYNPALCLRIEYLSWYVVAPAPSCSDFSTLFPHLL